MRANDRARTEVARGQWIVGVLTLLLGLQGSARPLQPTPQNPIENYSDGRYSLRRRSATGCQNRTYGSRSKKEERYELDRARMMGAVGVDPTISRSRVGCFAKASFAPVIRAQFNPDPRYGGRGQLFHSISTGSTHSLEDDASDSGGLPTTRAVLARLILRFLSRSVRACD